MRTTPHRTKIFPHRLGLALAAAGAILFTGCAQAPSAPAEQPAPPAADETTTWMGRVCEPLVPLTQRLGSLPVPDLADAAATRQAYVEYLDAAVQETDKAIETVTAAGPPPIEGGDAAANDIRGQLADLRRDLVQARDQIERADGDAAAVGQVVAATGNLIESFGNRLQAAAALTDDPRLEAAFEQAPQCRDLRAVDLPS
jgi:hypothetical protein